MKTPVMITYDRGADALYIYFRRDPTVARSRPMTDDIVLDFDAEGSLVGVEVLDLSTGADLSRVITEYDLDPSITDIVVHIRSLAPSVKDQLVLA